MSPKSLDAMDEGLDEDFWMEVRVDESVREPTYTANVLPGQGALLVPPISVAQSSNATPTVFQVTETHLNHQARVPGETHSRAGSTSEPETLPLSAPQLKEHDWGGNQEDREREPGLSRTPRNQAGRPSPSLSSMECGRPSARGGGHLPLGETLGWTS